MVSNTIVRTALGAVWVCSLLASAPASAGVLAFGPNTDFPDSNQVMPFNQVGVRQTYLTLSNVGAGPTAATWAFYDASGAEIIAVDRVILGEGGTDIVDPARVRSRNADGQEGPITDLSGRQGFVVVSAGDGEPRLISNFTIANVASNMAFGANGIGLGVVGLLAPNALNLGITFDPSTLDDDMLIIVGIDDLDAIPTSLTGGAAPSPGQIVFAANLTLHSNSGDGILASRNLDVNGSAFLSRLSDLFPGATLDEPATISVQPTTDGVTSIGWYGQGLGPYGAGQSLRTE